MTGILPVKTVAQEVITVDSFQVWDQLELSFTVIFFAGHLPISQCTGIT